ncbi:MAG TPA: HD domain-containing phosphohydrolase [Pyrinomonadaceae bacterium]|jgi:HD-GYP domain-containing protein (c-di-GMP phosphodiesterase class II)
MTATQPQLTESERTARDVFRRLAAAADEFEGYRHPHAERIAALADELAKLFGLGRADRAALRIAALAHDLGESAMGRDYIKRAGPLEEAERLDLLRHPVIGEQEAARAGAERGAQLLVRWSHEWWNGTGYPDALRREQIPLAARLLRVADAYASLTDARPYRPAFTEADARRHLVEWAGLEFDPQVVRAFLTLRDLPELRSYALLERPAAVEPEPPPFAPDDAEATTQTTPATQPTQTTRNEDDDARPFGHVPQAGTNPHVQRPTTAEADNPPAPAAPPDVW